MDSFVLSVEIPVISQVSESTSVTTMMLEEKPSAL